MSVCVEQTNFKNNQYSQSFPACDVKLQVQAKPRIEGLDQSTFNLISKTLVIWLNRSRQRKSLAALDERMLEDIGYTRSQARIESNKSFWK